MSEQALAESQGISAQLQERIRAFTAYYEQHAYLAYNLALRITCAPEPAARAVRRGFLRQLDNRPLGLIAGVVETALREGPARPDPSEAGDPEAQALMAAIAELAPAERAAMALADLAETGPDGIGEALGLPSDQAARLLHRARESFGARLGLPRTEADEAARDWMWAAPPNEIWEELYQEFHRTVERQLRRGAVEHTLVLTADRSARPVRKPSQRAVRRRLRGGRRWRPGLRSWRPRWSIAVPAAAIVLALGGAAAAQLLATGDDSSPASQAPQTPFSADQPLPGGAPDEPKAKPHKPLTAALLDKLRLRELRQLRAYTRRQADSSLPARQRRAAAERIAAIEREARARLRAQRKREAAALDREARERAAAQAPAPPSSSVPRRTSPTTSPSKPKRETTPSPTAPPRTREEADKTCLLDEDSGQYICPN